MELVVKDDITWCTWSNPYRISKGTRRLEDKLQPFGIRNYYDLREYWEES